MSENQTRTLAKLSMLLDRLKQGKNVQNRDLKTWLGPELYANFESMQHEQAELRDEIADKPAEIVEYERRLKKARFANNKAEGYSTRGKAAATRARHTAEELYEKALEYLQEIITADRSLCVWFDRDTEWAVDAAIAPSAGAMPLVVTSKSLDNMGRGILIRKLSVREMKISAIEMALRQLEDSDTLSTEAQEGKNRAFLRNLLGREVR